MLASVPRSPPASMPARPAPAPTTAPTVSRRLPLSRSLMNLWLSLIWSRFRPANLFSLSSMSTRSAASPRAPRKLFGYRLPMFFVRLP